MMIFMLDGMIWVKDGFGYRTIMRRDERIMDEWDFADVNPNEIIPL